MSFFLFMVREYLSWRKKTFLLKFLLVTSLVSMSLGVFALIMGMAVMRGFEKDFEKRIIGLRAPLSLVFQNHSSMDTEAFKKEISSQFPNLIFRSFVEGEAILKTTFGEVTGVRVRGIEKEGFKALHLGLYQEYEVFEKEALVLGDELANSISLTPGDEEKLNLIYPLGDMGPTGDYIPRARHATVTGVFHTGYYEFDSKIVLIPLESAYRLFGGEAKQGLEVWTSSLANADEAEKQIRILVNTHPDKEAMHLETWKDQNPKLFQAVRLEKWGLFILLLGLIAVACLNIYGFSSLMVMEKIKDMAVLQAVGLKKTSIRFLFLSLSGLLGVIGTALGGSIALGLYAYWSQYPPKLPSSYYIHTLPLSLTPDVVIALMSLVPIFAILASIYPAWQSSEKSPVEVLRDA